MPKRGQERHPRRLGAILFADVAGYSLLMGRDEEATHHAIVDYVRYFQQQIEGYDGQLIEVRGDGILALFDSVVNAVRYAVELQDVANAKSKDLPQDRQIKFRIGVNIGDVLLEDGRVYGDSVNIASRIEELAEPGGICVSGAVYEQIKNKLPYGYEYLGRHELKNITDPVEIFRVRKESNGIIMIPSPRLITRGLTIERNLPARPSVVVLPFENLSGDSTQDFFSDGVTDDITTNLSKFHGLFVIARSSAFVYKNKSMPVQQIAQDLGIRYILRGSVRRVDHKVRSDVQLVDAIEGHNLWAEQYDRQIDDIFAVQDEITKLTVAAAAVQIEAAERERMQRIKQPTVEAYGYVLQGQEKIFHYTKTENVQARELYEAALQHDPMYARAIAAISRTHNLDWRYSWTKSPEASLDKALELAQKAVELDESDARGHAELGFVYLYRKEHHRAVEEYERALRLNPNDADLMSDMADAFAHSGRSEEAIELLHRAMRLNPFYPDQYLWHLAGAYYNLRRYDEAIDAVLRMHNPTEGCRVLAASYAQLGRMKEARFHADKVLQAHPNFSLERWQAVLPDKNPEETAHFVEGLRKAGL